MFKVIRLLKSIKDHLLLAFKFLLKVNSFIVLLSIYLIMHATIKVTSFRFFPKFLGSFIVNLVTRIYDFVVFLNTKGTKTINRVNLIELSLKNMRFKFTRTGITIGGMSVGIAAIVFLVSLGYGVEKLVTTRVARLDELKQAEIQPLPGSNNKLNDKTLTDIKQFPNVSSVLPVIALVGKVNYKNSVSDMAVYGVTTAYLKQSAVKPIRGVLFESDAISTVYPLLATSSDRTKEAVAGDFSIRADTYLQKIKKVQFQINADAWLTIRAEPRTDAAVLGYTTRGDKLLFGNEVFGYSYTGSESGSVSVTPDGKELGRWILSEFLVWEKKDGKYVAVTEPQKNSQRQVSVEGYIAEIETDISPAESTIVKAESGDVLGLSTTNTSLSPTNFKDVAGESTQSAKAKVVEVDDKWVMLPDEASSAKDTSNTKIVKVSKDAKKEAVVNRAMLKLLGLSEEQAVGSDFEVSFVVTSGLLNDPKLNIKSEPTKYKIVGIIPQEDTPFFYVPFLDLRKLGVTTYSQAKVITAEKESLADVRQRIEASGFGTTSVVDTVAQIGVLFNTVRKILALIGAVALSVAALGMFNTLTVSLLERTHEIGLMKAMGMKSYEVQELFLTESMVMGVFGGILGLVFGWLAGKGLSILLSSIAIFKGVSLVNISYIPLPFIALIMVLSVTVGVLTGLYPARRATRISALNALRYE